MSGAQSISTRRAYGVERVCRVWHRARSSRGGRRHRPLRRVVAAGRSAWWPTFAECSKPRRFMARGYRKAWAKLRFPHLEGAGAPVASTTSRARGPRARAEGARRDHHHRGPDVMCDGHRDGRRGGGLRLRGRRSLRDRVRSPCPRAGTASRPWSRFASPGTLRGYRRRRGPRASSPARPRVELLGRRFPTGGRVLRHRKLPELRAGARRQRRCGALHPHAKGESVVGTELRDDRGTPPGLARVQTDVQQAVDAREIPIAAPPRCDATSLGWTRLRRSEYRQTTVQEPWGDTT